MSALVLGTSVSLAANSEDKVEASNMVSYGNPFIFVEEGITFSVYPDGEFDFYINERVAVGANVNFGNTSITFNSGYNYDPYVQYDDYGAVIQVENIPIYYDYYGRVSQLGNVNIWYRNGRVHRIGGMYMYYNPRGVFTHYTGYVNIYNRHYVYRPWHGYFVRPAVGFCLVYNRPYRRYYNPVRYTYYRPYAYNYRKAHARVGHHYRYQKSHNRDRIYRNDKRVVARNHSGRRSDSYRNNSSAPIRREAVATNRSSVKRSDAPSSRRTVTRSSSSTTRTIKRAEAPRANRAASVQRERTVTQRSVTRGPANKTVTRSSSTTVRKPVANNQRVQTQSPAKRTVRTRSSAPTRNSGTVSRSSAKRTVTKAPARANRSSQGVRERSKSTRVQ